VDFFDNRLQATNKQLPNLVWLLQKNSFSYASILVTKKSSSEFIRSNLLVMSWIVKRKMGMITKRCGI
jgi:hypothetical protein